MLSWQLACVCADSAEGRDYLAAMRAAANFAFVNRRCAAFCYSVLGRAGV